MPDYVMTSSWGLYLENLKTMLKNLTEFRTWSGTATAELAAARIHRMEQADAALTRPYVLIGFGGDLKLMSDAEGVGDSFGPWLDGSLAIMFEKLVSGTYPNPKTSDVENAIAEFADGVCLAIDGMRDVAGSDGILSIRHITPMTIRPVRFSKEDGTNTPYFQWAFEIGLP